MNRSKSHSGFLRSGGSIFQGKQASSEFGGLPGCSPPMAMICARHRLFRGLIAQFNQQNLLDMIQRDGQPAKGRRNSAICCLGSDLMRCAVLLPKTMGVPPLKVEDLEDLGSLADYLTIPWGLSESLLHGICTAAPRRTRTQPPLPTRPCNLENQHGMERGGAMAFQDLPVDVGTDQSSQAPRGFVQVVGSLYPPIKE